MNKKFQTIFFSIAIFMITLILTGCGVKKDLSTKDFIIIIANGSAQEVKDAVKRVDNIRLYTNAVDYSPNHYICQLHIIVYFH